MTSTKVVISSVICLSLVTIIIAVLASSNSKPQTAVISYSTSDQNKPRVETQNNFFDFGTIKVSDEKKADFSFKNSGNKPLQILSISSSCNCTFGQLVYKDKTSPEYGMHSPSGFVTEIAPDESAIVRVIYRPAIMPVLGIITRDVYLTTNDPTKPKLTFTIKATVQ